MTALGRAYGYWQTGDQLILNTGMGTLTYRSSLPDASLDQTYLLTGTNWFLLSYNANYSVPGEQEPFTLFNPNGTLTGYTGCNNFQGSWTSSPAAPFNKLTITIDRPKLSPLANQALVR